MQLMEPREFIRFLGEHGIRIRDQDLESFEKDGLLQPIFRFRVPKRIRKKLLHVSPLGQIDKIGFLMLLEEPYRFQAFGRISTPASLGGKRNSFEKWVKWRNTKFSSQKLLEQSKLSLGDVKKLYDWF